MTKQEFIKEVVGTHIIGVQFGFHLKDDTDCAPIEAIILSNGKQINLGGSEQICIGDVWADISKSEE